MINALMVNDSRLRQVIVSFVAVALLLMPFAQSIACASNSLASDFNSPSSSRSPSHLSHTPKHATTHDKCHNAGARASMAAPETDSSSRHFDCECDNSCCQAMVNVLTSVNILQSTDEAPSLVLFDLNSLKPDYIAFPFDPPPIV